MNQSQLPKLDIFEGLTKWGEVRLSPVHLDNLIRVEVRRIGKDEVWKPLFSFIALSGRLMFKIEAEHSSRVITYEPTTNTFSDIVSKTKVRDNSPLRNGEVGKDDSRSKDNT